MKFELEPYHRGLSDEELIAELRRVATELKKETLTRKEYKERGKYHPATLERRFDGWSNTLIIAGLTPTQTPRNIPDVVLIEELRRLAHRLQKETISGTENDEKGKYNRSIYIRRFGSWNNSLRRAGLKVGMQANLSEEDLFKNLEEIWVRLGRQPHFAEINKPFSQYSGSTYKRHFGSWRRALEQFVARVNDEERVAFEAVIEEQPASEVFIVGSAELTKRHKTKRNVNWRLRFLVMRRDNFKCQACGRSPATDSSIILHVDHVKAWSKGGETVLDNLQTLCSRCNIGKSNLD